MGDTVIKGFVDKFMRKWLEDISFKLQFAEEDFIQFMRDTKMYIYPHIEEVHGRGEVYSVDYTDMVILPGETEPEKLKDVVDIVLLIGSNYTEGETNE